MYTEIDDGVGMETTTATVTHPILTPEQAAQVRRRYSNEREWNGVKLTLIGGWQDLAGFYQGSDGNVWVCQSSFRNHGPLDERTFRNMRGGLFAS
jgi:hypothetical protein